MGILTNAIDRLLIPNHSKFKKSGRVPATGIPEGRRTVRIQWTWNGIPVSLDWSVRRVCSCHLILISSWKPLSCVKLITLNVGLGNWQIDVLLFSYQIFIGLSYKCVYSRGWLYFILIRCCYPTDKSLWYPSKLLLLFCRMPCRDLSTPFNAFLYVWYGYGTASFRRKLYCTNCPSLCFCRITIV